MDAPFRTPNPITSVRSKGLCSKSRRQRAAWRERKVITRCQLVKVVPGGREGMGGMGFRTSVDGKNVVMEFFLKKIVFLLVFFFPP